MISNLNNVQFEPCTSCTKASDLAQKYTLALENIKELHETLLDKDTQIKERLQTCQHYAQSMAETVNRLEGMHRKVSSEIMYSSTIHIVYSCIETLLEKAAEEYNGEHRAVIHSKRKVNELYTDVAECTMQFLGFCLGCSWEAFLEFTEDVEGAREKMRRVDIDAVDEETMARFKELKEKHGLSISRYSVRKIASEGIRKLQLVFGPIIRWDLLVYNISAKKKEAEKLENYICLIENKRNNLVQSLEEKKASLFKLSEKIAEVSKKRAELSQALILTEKAKKNPQAKVDLEKIRKGMWNKENNMNGFNNEQFDETFKGTDNQLSIVMEEEESTAKSFGCENVESFDSKIHLPQTNKSYSGKHNAKQLQRLGVDNTLSVKDQNIIREALSNPLPTVELVSKQQRLVDALKQTDSFIQSSDALRKSLLLSSRLHTLEEGGRSSRTWGRGEIDKILREKSESPDLEASFVEQEVLCSTHAVKQMTCKFLTKRPQQVVKIRDYEKNKVEVKKESRCTIF